MSMMEQFDATDGNRPDSPVLGEEEKDSGSKLSNAAPKYSEAQLKWRAATDVIYRKVKAEGWSKKLYVSAQLLFFFELDYDVNWLNDNSHRMSVDFLSLLHQRGVGQKASYRSASTELAKYLAWFVSTNCGDDMPVVTNAVQFPKNQSTMAHGFKVAKENQSKFQGGKDYLGLKVRYPLDQNPLEYNGFSGGVVTDTELGKLYFAEMFPNDDITKNTQEFFLMNLYARTLSGICNPSWQDS